MQQQHRALGALPRYADGGLIKQVKAGLNRLVGNNPEAMKGRGRTEQIEPEPKQQQASYASGVKTKDNPAGIKFARGGKVKGPGSGTSDDVPIMASNGEYVLKASAVKALGVKTLDALNAIADKTPGKGKMSAGKRKLGVVPRMREGGLVEEELRRTQGSSPESKAADRLRNLNARAKGARLPGSLTGAQPGDLVGKSPASSAVNDTMVEGGRRAVQARPPLQIGYTPPAPANAVAPYVNHRFYDASKAPGTGFTRVGEGVSSSSAPSRGAGAPRQIGYSQPKVTLPPGYKPPPVNPATGEYIRPGQTPAAAQPATQPQPAKPAATTRLGQVAGRAGGAVRQAINSPVARAFVAPAAAASSAADTFETPTSDYETRFGFGPSTSDSPTVNLVRDIGVRALGAASDLGNTLTLGAAGQFYRDKQAKAGQLTPADPVPAQPGGAAPTAAPATAPATAPAQVAATAAPAQPLGRVTRVGNSYSGENVAGNVEFVDAAGNPRPAGGGFVGGTGDGTFRYGGASGQSGADQALHAARMAAVERGDIEAVRQSYGGNFGGRVAGDEAEYALLNNGRPMTTRKLGAIQKARADRAATAGAAEDRALARDKFRVDARGAQIDQAMKQRLDGLQSIISDPNTPAEQRRSAVEIFNTLMGTKPVPSKGYGAIAGGVDAMGNRTDPLIYSQDTGAVVNRQTLPPGMVRQVGTSNGKPVYEDKDGKRFGG